MYGATKISSIELKKKDFFLTFIVCSCRQIIILGLKTNHFHFRRYQLYIGSCILTAPIHTKCCIEANLEIISHACHSVVLGLEIIDVF